MDQSTNLGPFGAISKLWSELGAGQRILVVAFVAMAVVVVSFGAMVASRPRMSVLFSGLELEDAGAIVKKLDDEKVSYKLSGDGTTIEVPSSQVYDMRLRMATHGLPQGGSVGFEQFDKSSFGMTEFTERVTYQRAMQGELRRTIAALAPVMDARVHLALPQDKVYASEQAPTTASVVLELRRGTPLGDEQVGGIVHLVASAVEGLRPANVTVVDSQGNVLSEALAGMGGGAGRLTSNQTKLKRQFESDLSANLQSMLARIAGPDNVVVRVSADMNFDRKQATSETYEPTQAAAEDRRGVLLSQETTTETYTGRVTPPGGVPEGERAAEADTYELAKSNTQYHVSKRVEEIVTAPGQVKRLSVAVLIDEAVKVGMLDTIRAAATAAAGIDEERGDQITVQRLAFDTSAKEAADAATAGASKSDGILGIAKNVGAAVLLVVFLVFLRSIVKQIKVQAPSVPAAAPVPGPSAGAGMQMPAAANVLNEVPQAVREPVEVQVPAHVESPPVPRPDLPPEVSESNPEELARLVRTWMSEQQ